MNENILRGELPTTTVELKSNPDQNRTRLYSFLSDHASSKYARYYHYYLDTLVALSMITLCLATIPGLADDPWESKIWYGLESFIAINFLIDILLKLASASPTTSYLCSWTALTDTLSVVPWITETIVWIVTKHSLIGDQLEKLNMLRLLRMLRFARFYSATFSAFPEMHLFVQAVKQSKLAVVFLIFFICFAGIFFSSLLYYAETNICHYDKSKRKWFVGNGQTPSTEECTFQNIFEASWFVMVTITTVGYGDVQLKTTVAKVITVLMMICSVIGLSLPVAIFGANLTELYLERRLYHNGGSKRMIQSPRKEPRHEIDVFNNIATELTSIRLRLEQLECK